MEHMEQLEEKIQDISEELKMIKLLKEEDLFYKKAHERLGQLNERFLSLSTNSVMKSIRDLTKKNPAIHIHNEADLIHESKKHDRKYQLYASKLKFCTKIYSTLNVKLIEEIKTLRRLYANSNENINSCKVTTEEIHQLEARIKRYNGEIEKLEKKYPWLTEETELKLPNIITETAKLDSLRQQHTDLKNELDCYKGLSCDLFEAQKQLADLKRKYEHLSQLNK